MLNETQKKFVIDELKRCGSVSRNYCLRNYITRLGAIICQLNKEGWNLKGKYVEYETNQEKHKDFVYFDRSKIIQSRIF